MTTSRSIMKMLIEHAEDVKKADDLIVENYGFTTPQEKIAFLKGMFDFEIISHIKGDLNEIAYFLMLKAILAAQ